MPTSVGPNTKGEENLVFGYDLGDVSNSYKGEPTTNVIADPEPLSGWTISNNGTSAATITYSSDNGIPHMELSSVNVDGSYPRIYMANLTSTITDGFSISFEAKSNVSNVQLGLALYSLASTKITQYATLSTEWQRFEFENLTTGFTLDDGYLRIPSTTSGAVYYIRRIQVEQKTHATPFVAGTRSATQGLLDLTGNSTADLTNVSFDSNAQITFDGTDDEITVPDSALLDLTTEMSFEFVFKASSSQSNLYPRLIDKSSWLVHILQTPPFGYYQNVYTSAGLRQTGTTSATIQADTWYHIASTYNGQIGRIYINGNLERTQDFGSVLPCTVNGTAVTIGGDTGTSRQFNGQIPVVKIYNRALTASEIKSNFNAIKRRFNI